MDIGTIFVLRKPTQTTMNEIFKKIRVYSFAHQWRFRDDLGNQLLKMLDTYIGMNNRYREEKTESNNATKVIKIRDDA
jgi:hypothetical protein